MNTKEFYGEEDNGDIVLELLSPMQPGTIRVVAGEWSYGGDPSGTRILEFVVDGVRKKSIDIIKGGPGTLSIGGAWVLTASTNAGIQARLEASGTGGVFGRLTVWILK